MRPLLTRFAVYSVSEPFEIKKEGSHIILPAKYSSSIGGESHQQSSSASIGAPPSPRGLVLFSTFTLSWALSASASLLLF